MTQGCERWDDELAGYAVGALSPADRSAVEAHLAGCSRCAERLRWFSPAVDALAETVPPETPPAELRERVLATVYADADAARRRERHERRGERLAAGRERLRRRLSVTFRPATVGLAVVALLLAGVVGYAIRGGDGEGSVTLTAEAGAGAATAELSVRDDAGTLTVDGLPTPGPNEVYQAWVGADGEITPSTVFVLDRNGETSVGIPSGLEAADTVLVSREPAGGSEQPTGPTLFTAEL